MSTARRRWVVEPASSLAGKIRKGQVVSIQRLLGQPQPLEVFARRGKWLAPKVQITDGFTYLVYFGVEQEMESPVYREIDESEGGF